MKTFSFKLLGYTVTFIFKKKHAKDAGKETFEQDLNDRIEKLNLKFREEACKPVTVNEFLENAGLKERKSVEECFTEYIESKRGVLAESTIKGYENIRDKHLDYIMIRYMDSINEDDVQKAFDQEIAKGLSTKTLKGYWTLLNKVLAIHRPDLKTNVILDYEPDFKWDTKNREDNE